MVKLERKITRKRKPSIYKLKDQEKIILMVNEGKTISEIAKAFHSSESTVYRCVKRIEKNGGEAVHFD